MMYKFETGDKVISDRYGCGIVTGESHAKYGVKVDFANGPQDCVYHFVTGKRCPKCGNDRIVLVEVDEE